MWNISSKYLMVIKRYQLTAKVVSALLIVDVVQYKVRFKFQLLQENGLTPAMQIIIMTESKKKSPVSKLCAPTQTKD